MATLHGGDFPDAQAAKKSEGSGQLSVHTTIGH